MVASRTPGGAPFGVLVSIPFIAGQWSLQRALVPRQRLGSLVSIPFIAGQWSLLGKRRRSALRLKPSLNPLHCGAVVASNARLAARRGGKEVSIPFIAGQWSLHQIETLARLRARSQSPSLRGSGRFSEAQLIAELDATASQSPSLRGSGRFRRRARRRKRAAQESQSPSLRGSGRFTAGRGGDPARSDLSQSPSLRGSGRFLPTLAPERTKRLESLNPLHCGAVVASSMRRAT